MEIVSGGQTGVDRAALDAAAEAGLERGGWCPRGRWAEDGEISLAYPLRETPSSDPAQRTEWNVRDSDATLLLTRAPLVGGTALTRDAAERFRRPWLVLDPWRADPSELLRWLAVAEPRRLNVAGPRESEAPGIYAAARALLHRVFARTT